MFFPLNYTLAGTGIRTRNILFEFNDYNRLGLTAEAKVIETSSFNTWHGVQNRFATLALASSKHEYSW
jgi:hypothetical protein